MVTATEPEKYSQKPRTRHGYSLSPHCPGGPSQYTQKKGVWGWREQSEYKHKWIEKEKTKLNFVAIWENSIMDKRKKQV